MTYDCTVDLDKALDWQRSKAPILKALIQKKQEWYEANFCGFWNNWTVDVFNLDTANEFGLSVWSIILDEPLFGITQASPPDYPSWGFTSDDEVFGFGSFGTNSDVGYNFTIEQKRILLKLKAYILHMSGSVTDINKSMVRIFGAGEVKCIDALDMNFVYLIGSTELVGFMREIKTRDLLPRPASVAIRTVLNENTNAWGFGESFENFGNGNFYDGEI